MTATFDRQLNRDLTDLADSMPLPPTPAQVGFVTPGVITHARRVRRRRRLAGAALGLATALAVGGGSTWLAGVHGTTSSLPASSGAPTPSASSSVSQPSTPATTSPTIAQIPDEAQMAQHNATQVARFTQWAQSLPEGEAIAGPVLGGRVGRSTVSYRGHTASLPEATGGIAQWWSTPSGVVMWLWFVTADQDQLDGQLAVLSGSGRLRLLARGDIGDVVLSRDGAQAAYIASGGNRGSTSVRLVDLAGGTEVAATSVDEELLDLVWLPQGVLLRGQTERLWVPGQTPTPVSEAQKPITAISSDGITALAESTYGCQQIVDQRSGRTGTPILCDEQALPWQYQIGPGGTWLVVGGTPVTPAGRRMPSMFPPETSAESWLWVDHDTVGVRVESMADGIRAADVYLRCELATSACARVTELGGTLPSLTGPQPAVAANSR